MKTSPFLGVIAAGVLFGWFAPDFSRSAETSHAESGDAAKPIAADHSRRLAVARQAAGEVVLPRAPDGHFYADVTVEGVTKEMLIDTGASVIALTGPDAEAMGLYWTEADVAPVARGASGTVYGVPVTLNLVQVGDFEVQAVEAVIVPRGLGVSLLGQSFLSQVGRVEIEGEQMVLGG